MEKYLSGGSPHVVLCPDGATVIDRWFGSCDLLYRDVIHHPRSGEFF
jgi:hypothetical protein